MAPEADEEILTPKETEKPFWVGLVIQGGTVALPPKLVQPRAAGRSHSTLSRAR